MNEPVTITLEDGLQASLPLPAFAVAYAIVEEDLSLHEEIVETSGSAVPVTRQEPVATGGVRKDGPVRASGYAPGAYAEEVAVPDPANTKSYRLIVALKMAGEQTYYSAYHRARREFPNLPWVRLEATENGACSGGARDGGYSDVTFVFDDETQSFQLKTPSTDPMLRAYRGITDTSPIEVLGSASIPNMTATLAKLEEQDPFQPLG